MLISFLIGSSLFAQDSVADSINYAEDEYVYSEPPKIKFTPADVKIDTDPVVRKHFEKNFKAKYRGEAFDYAPKPKPKSSWDRFADWFMRALSSVFSTGGSGALSAIEWTFKIICGLVIVLVIYLIVKAVLNKEGKWIFGRGSKARIMNPEEVERNLHSIDFEELVSETLASGNKRLAIRYYYLWLLKRLTQSGVIEWDPEKTNSDYLYEIRNEKDRENFAYLSYLYNHIWYGEFETDDVSFAKASKAFCTTIKAS